MQFGAGYRNHRSEIKFLPFVEQFWYAGGEKAGKHHNLSRYSKLYGTELAISHWINARWKTSTLLEFSEQRYKLDNRKLSNGNNYAISHTLGFYPSSSQYWFLGTDYYRKNARWRANAFERYGIRLGWSQMWSKGIATQLQLNYARRIYQMASAKPEDIFAPNFFKRAQKNHEYGLSLTLWQRDLSWKGITPKVTWSYQNIKSNNPFAVYDRQRVYLTLSKGF